MHWIAKPMKSVCDLLRTPGSPEAPRKSGSTADTIRRRIFFDAVGLRNRTFSDLQICISSKGGFTRCRIQYICEFILGAYWCGSWFERQAEGIRIQQRS